MASSVESVYRDYITTGVPASGDHKPSKPEIRALLKQIQNSSGQSVTRNTLSALNAVTPPNENYMGIVLTGSDAGFYSRSGGSWVFGRGFPDTFAKVTLLGTSSTQSGSLGAGVNPANIEVFYAEVVTPNSGSLTLSIAGGASLPVVNVAGNALSPGEWSNLVIFYKTSDNKYQLMLDGAAALSAAASATSANANRILAQAAADRAEDAAAGVEFPLSYGLDQTLDDAKRRQARANAGFGYAGNEIRLLAGLVPQIIPLSTASTNYNIDPANISPTVHVASHAFSGNIMRADVSALSLYEDYIFANVAPVSNSAGATRLELDCGANVEFKGTGVAPGTTTRLIRVFPGEIAVLRRTPSYILVSKSLCWEDWTSFTDGSSGTGRFRRQANGKLEVLYTRTASIAGTAESTANNLPTWMSLTGANVISVVVVPDGTAPPDLPPQVTKLGTAHSLNAYQFGIRNPNAGSMTHDVRIHFIDVEGEP